MLMRSISNLSALSSSSSNSNGSSMVLSSNQAAGALAAAGLLQLSPGCYVATPPSLQKLLSKAVKESPRQGYSNATASAAGGAATAAGGGGGVATASMEAVGIAPGDRGVGDCGGREGGRPGSGRAAGAGQRQRPYHCRCSSSEVVVGGGALGGLVTAQQPAAAVTAAERQHGEGSGIQEAAQLQTPPGTAEGQVAGAGSTREQQQFKDATPTAAGVQSTTEADAIAVITLPLPGPTAVAAAAGKGEATSGPLCGSPVLGACTVGSVSYRATVDTVIPTDHPAVELMLPQLDALAVSEQHQQLQPVFEGAAVSPGCIAAAAAATAAVTPAPGHAAGVGPAAGGGGGFGRILVRRRFVRNMQATMAAGPHFKRWV
jgi:hypothetical protein